MMWRPLLELHGSWLMRFSKPAELRGTQGRAGATQCCAVLKRNRCWTARLVMPTHLIAQEQAVHVFNGGNQSINVSLLLSDLSKAATTAIEISIVIRPKVIHLDKILALSHCGKGLPQAIYFRQLAYLIKDIDQVAHVLKIVNLPVELEGSVTAVAAQQQRFLKVLGPAEGLSNSTTTYEHTKSD